MVIPPGLDPSTSVLSKDVNIIPVPASDTDPAPTLSAGIYIPSSALSTSLVPKLPVILYFHGGAFIICSIAYPNYHNSLNTIVSLSETILISLDYRRCPEHPLLTAYDDSRTFLLWILTQSKPDTPIRDPWLERMPTSAISSWGGQLQRVYQSLPGISFQGMIIWGEELMGTEEGNIFLGGDRRGANLAHHLALRVSRSLPGISFQGMIMIHPSFWGEELIGTEKEDDLGRRMVDSWWRFVCPSDKGMPISQVVVTVAGEDILKDRGRLFYEMLMEKSTWKGKAEIFEMEDAEHMFHSFDHECNKAKDMFKNLARFIHEN